MIPFHRAALAMFLGVVPILGGQTPRTTFVTVEKDVALEVLDWGGAGVPVVLLAGRGQTAHSFETFAPSLASLYHVYAVTRRGYGASSKPATGYLSDRLANDVLAIVDSLHLTRPVLAGHSLAGQELSSIGTRHSERVAGLIYLDAGYAYAVYDSARGDFRADVAVLKQRLERLQQAGSRGDRASMDTIFSALLNQDLPLLKHDLTVMQGWAGQVAPGTPLLPPVRTGIEREIDDGLQRYTNIRGPVLALFAQRDPPPGVGSDKQITQQWIQRDRGNVGTFARIIPQAQILILPNADHFVFNSNRAEVIAAMRAFIDGLPRR